MTFGSNGATRSRLPSVQLGRRTDLRVRLDMQAGPGTRLFGVSRVPTRRYLAGATVNWFTIL
jgi:hypothetical protein